MFDLFIDSRTGGYPRHLGDVELEPGDFWVPVVRTKPIDIAPEGYSYIETTPKEINGIYYQAWQLEIKPVVNLVPVVGPKARLK